MDPTVEPGGTGQMAGAGRRKNPEAGRAFVRQCLAQRWKKFPPGTRPLAQHVSPCTWFCPAGTYSGSDPSSSGSPVAFRQPSGCPQLFPGAVWRPQASCRGTSTAPGISVRAGSVSMESHTPLCSAEEAALGKGVLCDSWTVLTWLRSAQWRFLHELVTPDGLLPVPLHDYPYH